MGRKKDEGERFMFRVSPSDADAIRQAAKKLALNESDYIRDAVRKKLREDGLL